MIKLSVTVSYKYMIYICDIVVMKMIDDMNVRLSNAENSITLIKAMCDASNGSSDGSGL